MLISVAMGISRDNIKEKVIMLQNIEEDGIFDALEGFYGRIASQVTLEQNNLSRLLRLITRRCIKLFS